MMKKGRTELLIEKVFIVFFIVLFIVFKFL